MESALAYRKEDGKLTKEKICQFFKNKQYKVLYINFQHNSINGIIKKKKRYFFKILKREDYINEKKGYDAIKRYLPVSKLVSCFQLNHMFVMILEYEKTIKKNKGLLHDYLIKRDEKKINLQNERKFDTIIRMYKENYQKTEILQDYAMKQFYQDRVKTRLITWYEKEELFHYTVWVNQKGGKTTKDIIKETIQYFQIKNSYPCAITQGDPNSLNIGMRPVFFDFSTAGKNPIVGELAAIFWSVLIADAYFCPKYHRESYFQHEKVIKKIDRFSPNINYKVEEIEKRLLIEVKIKTSRIRKQFIYQYLEMLEQLPFIPKEEIIYFLVMRVLCIFDITQMEEADYFYSLSCIHSLYYEIKEEHKSLKEIIKEWKEI